LVQGNSVGTGRPLPETVPQLLIALSRKQIDVYAELRAQIEKIQAAGLRPTHLDSHKHTHIWPSVFRIVVRLAHEFGIPHLRLPFDDSVGPNRRALRLIPDRYRRVARDQGISMTEHFLGFRLTGSLTEEALATAIRSLPEGTTEFMCHPGYAGTELQNARTRLKESRVRELEALTSPRIRELIHWENISLVNFTAVATDVYNRD
jgi:predicted glycoside hydrolase/deacetylase ChbG (UPF0249 family)